MLFKILKNTNVRDMTKFLQGPQNPSDQRVKEGGNTYIIYMTACYKGNSFIIHFKHIQHLFKFIETYKTQLSSFKDVNK